MRQAEWLRLKLVLEQIAWGHGASKWLDKAVVVDVETIATAETVNPSLCY